MQLKAMSNTTNPKQKQEEVRKCTKQGNILRNQPHQRYISSRGNKQHDAEQCYRCGDTSHTKGQQCPAIEVECFNCNKHGHFSKVYKSRTRSDMMTLQKEEPYGITSECSRYTNVFLGTLEAQDSFSASMIARIKQRKKWH